MEWKSSGRPLFGCLAVLAFVLALSIPAAAQSQSERLAELERLIEIQQTQLQALQAQVKDLIAQRRTAAAAVTASEPARRVTSSKDTASLSIYGQVNRGILYANDGHSQEVFNVDNDHSSTRIGFLAEAKARDGLTVGSRIEVQMESNSSGSVNQARNAPGGPVTFTERKLEVFAKSERLGTVWLGQGSTASDGTAESDLSGTGVAGRSNFGEFGGGLSFATSGTGNIAGNPTVAAVFNNMDGLSRNDRLRYDTPSFGGLSFATSWVDGGPLDGAVRYSREFGDQKVAAALGYVNVASSSSTISRQVSGSASYLLGNGLNATFAAGRRELKGAGRSDADFYYLKLGYRARLNRFGLSSFAVDFGEENDLALNGDEGRMYGAQFVQNLDEFGVELYLSFRNFSLDRTGASFDDINAVLAGVRMKF